MSAVSDPIRRGLANGWKVHGAAYRALPETLSCDVAIVGTGAGAGITAELLTGAGLDVVLIEEGPLRSSSDFRQLESEAYTTLYQESASRKTEDKAVAILQGRCVGGSTTVNWTSSFRTPPATLAYWQQHFDLADFGTAEMQPWFEQVERRLNIAPWQAEPNANNAVLRDGAARMGVGTHAMDRNVRACWNLGSCGLGCPTNAKQSMLVTTIPTAMDRGARLLVQTRAERLELGAHGRVLALVASPVTVPGAPAPGAAVRVVARHYVVAGGAINTPGLLLRSRLPDPHDRLGARTFLHPVVASSAVFADRIEGWRGAPQTVYSDHYLDHAPFDGPIGFKLEVPPLHPVIGATTLPGFGAEQAAALKLFPHTQALLALMRDGFHAESPGGRVRLRRDGTEVLDYPLTDYVFEGARRAFRAMAEIQFAAGARIVRPVHEEARDYTTWAQAKKAIDELRMQPYLTRVLSAHVMGGCAIAGRPELGVTRPDGRHWQVDNLSIHDGSLFPTSIGANPQVSVYGLANRLASGLARALTGREVSLA